MRILIITSSLRHKHAHLLSTIHKSSFPLPSVFEISENPLEIFTAVHYPIPSEWVSVYYKCLRPNKKLEPWFYTSSRSWLMALMQLAFLSAAQIFTRLRHINQRPYQPFRTEFPSPVPRLSYGVREGRL